MTYLHHESILISTGTLDSKYLRSSKYTMGQNLLWSSIWIFIHMWFHDFFFHENVLKAFKKICQTILGYTFQCDFRKDVTVFKCNLSNDLFPVNCSIFHLPLIWVREVVIGRSRTYKDKWRLDVIIDESAILVHTL